MCLPKLEGKGDKRVCLKLPLRPWRGDEVVVIASRCVLARTCVYLRSRHIAASMTWARVLRLLQRSSAPHRSLAAGDQRCPLGVLYVCEAWVPRSVECSLEDREQRDDKASQSKVVDDLWVRLVDEDGEELPGDDCSARDVALARVESVTYAGRSKEDDGDGSDDLCGHGGCLGVLVLAEGGEAGEHDQEDAVGVPEG